jgi:hypothetical protein
VVSILFRPGGQGESVSRRGPKRNL